MTPQPTDDRLAQLAAEVAKQIESEAQDAAGADYDWLYDKSDAADAILVALRTVRAEAAEAQVERDCAAVCEWCKTQRYGPVTARGNMWIHRKDGDGGVYCAAGDIRTAALAATLSSPRGAAPDAGGEEK